MKLSTPVVAYKISKKKTPTGLEGNSKTGEGGIRTHEQSPVKRFRIVRFRPLSHLSVIK